MPINWFIEPLSITIQYPAYPYATRHSPVADYLSTVATRSGAVEMTKHLLYKVSAEQAILDTMQGRNGVLTMPGGNIDQRINAIPGALTTITAILAEVLGLTIAEVGVQFPTLGSMSQRQVMRVMATERIDPTFNTVSGRVVYNGDTRPCEDIDRLDERVRD